MEPTCGYCGISDKGRCKTREQAAKCAAYFEKEMDSRGINMSFDFGFTEPVDVQEISELADRRLEIITKLNKQVKDLDKRMNTLYNSIIPFLDKLMSGGDKDIHWPGRAAQIDEFKSKLTDIVEGK